MSPTQRINQAAVIEASLSLLEREGAKGLTMRALANQLGIQAASLYHHVADRDELLRLIADSVALKAIRKMPLAAEWRELARGLADNLLSALREHPRVAQIVAVQEISSTVFEPISTVVDETFLPALDLDHETALHLLQGLYVLVVGLALAESGDTPRPPTGPLSYYDVWYEVAVETYLDGITSRFQH